jgi:hypothetical protein
MARINPPEFRTLKQAPCQDLLFAYKSKYTEINSGILIRGLIRAYREFGESFVYLVYVWSNLVVLGISPTERFERLVLGAWNKGFKKS